MRTGRSPVESVLGADDAEEAGEGDEAAAGEAVDEEPDAGCDPGVAAICGPFSLYA